MGRPKKEKYEIEERFLQEALLLAERYSESVRERNQLRNLMLGDFEYTEDMAIQDLTGGAVRYDTERVQTSNISNEPERIAILLDNGYVWKEKQRIREEARKQQAELDRLNREIGIVEVAMNERMDDRTKAVFRCLYIEHRPWSKVRDECGNCLKPQQINAARQRAIRRIAEEVMSVQYIGEQEGENGAEEKGNTPTK